jgi:hypothetical protein
LSFRGALAGPIPGELVGEWVTANVKFNHGVLVHGSAIYLRADGFAANFGAEDGEVIGMAGSADFDTTKGILTLKLHDNGKPPEREKLTVFYDAKSRTLTMKATEDTSKSRFKFRQNRIPKWVIEETK